MSTFVVFRRFQDLMANIFGMKHDTDNQKKTLKTKNGLLHAYNFFHEL